MSDKKKRIFKKGITGRGVLKYCWLNKADVKYKKDGEFHCTIRLFRADNLKLINELETAAQAAYKEALAEIEEKNLRDKKTGKLLKIECHVPVLTEFEKDGTDTGYVTMRFPTKKLPTLRDSRGNKITGKRPDVWGGTEAQVAFSYTPFFAPALLKAGVTLYLDQVLLIRLAAPGGADDSPFEAIEDGFVYEDTGEEAPTDVVQEATAGQTEDNY